MTDDKHQREGQSGRLAKRNSAKDPRRDRLKQALRDNLKRRKSQAKARSDIAAAPLDDRVSSLEASEKKPSG
jgi:hypothetical protein